MPLGNPIRKQNESRIVSVLATEGQSVFTVEGGYIINHISVFRNGVRLSNSEDFTAGDGSTVTLNNEANVDDRIEFHIFDRFTVQNAIVGAASSQTISGDLVLTGKLFGNLDVPSINTGIVTATELDLNGKGDISGDLNVTGVTTTGGGNISGDLNVTGVTTVGKQVHVGTGVSIAAGGLNVTAGISTFQAIQGTTGTFSGDITANGNIAGDNSTNITGIAGVTASTLTGTLQTAAQANVTSVGTLTGLTVSGDVSIADKIVHTGDTNTAIRFPAADTITAETAGSERLRIDSSGRVIIGHNASVAGDGSSEFSFQILGTTYVTSGLNQQRYANDISGPSIILSKSRATSVGTHTIVQNGDQLGKIRFYGSDGNDFDNYGAEIAGHVDGSPGSDDMPGRLVFKTTADGAASPTERVRIDSAGRVMVGTTSPQGVLTLNNTGQTTQTLLLCEDTGGSGAHAHIILKNTTGQVASIVTTSDNLEFRVDDETVFADASGNEHARITSGGALGIGTDSPDQSSHPSIHLHSDQSDDARISITTPTKPATRIGYFGLSNKFGVDIYNGFEIRDVGASYATRFLIDSSGRVLIGSTTSTPMDNDANNPIFAVEGQGNGARIAVRSLDTTAGNGAFVYLTRTRGTSAGSKTTVQDGDTLGGLIFMGADGTHDTRAAIIRAECDGTPGNDDMPGRLVFSTTADGGINPGERMRITSDGKLCVATTSTTSLGSQTGASNVSTFNQSGITLTQYGVTAGFYYDRINYTNSQYYIVNSSGTGVYLGNGNTSWSAHSDERLKTNITELDGTKAYNHVKTARATSFKWNATGYPTDNKIGFIAQDWETNYPEVTNTTSETIDGVENPKAIQYTETIPVLMAALKQAIAKIETLEAKVAALEGS